RAWMADGEWDGRLSLAIRDADWPGYGSGFSAGATMVGKWFGGALSVSLPIDAWANLSGLDTDLVAKTGLAGFAQGGIELRIPAAGAAPFSLAIRPLRDGLDLAASGTMRVESAAGGVFEAAGELRIAGEETVRGTGRIDLVHDEIVAGPVAAKDLRIRLPVAFTIAPDRLHLALSGDGAWRASVPRIGGVAVAADDLVLEIANGTLEAWRADSGADWALSYAALVRPGAFAGVIDAGLAEPVRVETGWQSIAVDGVGASGADVGGRVVIAGATVAVPGYGLGAKGVEAVLSIPPSESAPLARFSIARLGHGGVSPLVVPLAAEGTVWAGDSGLTFGVELRDLAANKWIEINGSHNPETGEGEGLIAMPATLLAPSGRQLNDLTPILEPLGAVAGSVRAEVRLGWTENGLRQSGFLGLDDVSMAMAAASVSGLNAEIRFDGLLPPSTPPAQLATVRRLDAAVPMTDLVIRFALPSESPPRLILDSAVAGFAGGVVSVGETTLGPALARQTLPLAISGLDLAELFALLDLDGVAGSGVIDGTLPLAITDGVVTLNGGNLRARGPGALQIQSAAVATALAGGGEPVALMLRAMENFAFDSLSMEIDKDAAGDAVLKLQMAGRNPDLDAGRPFEFNINLDTNLDRVLAAIGEGARLTNELLSRAWGLIP
ncbi:MAG: YdbH domain-containing protein, partial [Alphaproteobacteria bacterium]|nr:YdbH domain-containing protein [Alphaproteobacteria bacterium]